MKFQATIRFWRPERASGLAVADIPPEQVAALGGLKQMRVRGTINGADYAAFDSRREGWLDLVTDDMFFGGAMQHARGNAEFISLTGDFLRAHRETRRLGRADAGNRVASVARWPAQVPCRSSPLRSTCFPARVPVAD